MAHRPLERAVEAAFNRLAQERGVASWKLTVPGIAGVPDRLLLAYPGRAAFAELKRPGEKPRALQRTVIAFLRKLGFEVAEIDSVEAARAFFERWPG